MELFTSESVTEGHPDKIADGISDTILDSALSGDKESRVACETLVTTGLVLVAGEISTRTSVPFQELIRKRIQGIGYTHSEMGFDFSTCSIQIALDRQSPDISRGVGSKGKKEQGAGDQGLMFGFACDETPSLMPLPIELAHRLAMRLTQVRKSKTLPYLRPDGKTQVTVEYRKGRPHHLNTVVISCQHSPNVGQGKIKKDIENYVMKKVLPARFFDKKTKIFVNPTGRFVLGGPQADCGLTGRKIIVDTYGGYARHGGGAFSGKDPSKVDRSAAYIARYIAKNLVAAKVAPKIEVQLAYAIGVALPVSVRVDTFETNTYSRDFLEDLVRSSFPLTPREMIETLKLKEPIYAKTSCYGHFGREEFTWEKLDRVAQIKKFLKKSSHSPRPKLLNL